MAPNYTSSSQVLDLFSRFSFDKLSNDWVNFIIDTDFSEIEALPTDFEEAHAVTNFKGLLTALNNALREFVDSLSRPDADESRRSASFDVSTMSENGNQEIETSSKFWLDLAQVAKMNNIMAFLYYHVHLAVRYDAQEEERELGSLAGSFYCILLCIPGSNAFRVFQPSLLLRVLSLMRLTTKLHLGASSPRKGKGPISQTARRAPKVVEDDEDEEAEETFLTEQEANKLVRNLNVLLSDFIRLTSRFSLKHSPESLDEVISVLVDVTRSETRNAHSVFLEHHGTSSVTSLVYNSYVALQCICTKLHGNIQKLVKITMKHIISNILMIPRGGSDLSARSLGVIRDHAIIFVKYILTQIKDPAYDAVFILVQHLCARVPDKAEFRQKTAQSVVEILRHLPIKVYSDLIKWFHKFSHNEKAGHRLFTLEIIAKMLTEDERQDEERGEGAGTPCRGDKSLVPGNQNPDNAAAENSANMTSFNIVPTSDRTVVTPASRNILSHKFLLSIIFSRCRDSAATVRAKALALLAECTISDNPTITLAMKQIFLTKAPEIFTTPHIVDNEINIESPIENLQDEEGMEMPNAVMILALLKKRARDDKVSVRKSSLQVLENLMKLDPQMVHKKNVQVGFQSCTSPFNRFMLFFCNFWLFIYSWILYSVSK